MKIKDFIVETNSNNFIKKILYKNTRLNLLDTDSCDTPVLNVHVKRGEQVITLLSLDNDIRCTRYESAIEYEGKADELTFKILFKFNDNNLFVDVELSEELPIYFVTDVGLADDSIAKLAMYGSQYIDNKVYEDNTIAMRKTMKSQMGNPYAEFGSFEQIESYCTEGYDFFGLKYKENKEIQGLFSEKLASRPKNYELALVALQVKATNSATFYISIDENMPHAIGQKLDLEQIKYSYINATLDEKIETSICRGVVPKLINGIDLTQAEIEKIYSERLTEEFIDNELASFFTPEHAHVVLKNKELKTERAHAHIINTGLHSTNNDKQFVSTNYMNGIFSAQNAVGNTQQNALNSNAYSLLFNRLFNGMKIALIDGEYEQFLNVPSVYEMGINYAKWIYNLDDNKIVIKCYTETENPNWHLEIYAENPVELVVYDRISPNFNLINNTFYLNADTYQATKLPELRYSYKCHEGEFTDNDFEDEIYSIHYPLNTKHNLDIFASKTEQIFNTNTNFEVENLKYKMYYDKLLGNLKLTINNDQKQNIESLNHMLYWYVHNALVHFATPHGVEQHAGAAWGTRDVCQGPVELFAALGKYELVREILLKVYENQFIEEGDWPQWFMFDEYEEMRQFESHGDVIVWPLKALSDYLLESGDLSILDETRSYFSYGGKRVDTSESIFEHVIREINYIKQHVVEGTHLSKYGEGDWDDTLQPINSDLRNNMISGWTIPLTYQTLTNFAKAIKEYDEAYSQELSEFAKLIKIEYRETFIKNGIVAGFVYKNAKNEFEYLLHPEDKRTGIKYRLLPINRSIISGIFTDEEIKTHLSVVNQYLTFPDGIRLMDRPAKYNGGVSEMFDRAETASTVGREVSLQYVHAHIRFIEAMTVYGDSERAYSELLKINPFRVKPNVANANIRQSNAYYSSSEGDFNNRYDYVENFEKLRTGQIEVKSGWRIYSSGPGILLKQLISNILGFKYENGSVKIEPKVSKQLNGLVITRDINGEEYILEFDADAKEYRATKKES